MAKSNEKDGKKEPEKGRLENGRFSKHNLFALGLKNSGRKKMIETPEEMEEKALEYFESLIVTDDEGKSLFMGNATITGVILHLGFSSREGFYGYVKRPEFTDIIRRIQLTVQNCYERVLFTKSSNGAQFALKNMGWKDQSEVLSTNVNLSSDLEEEEKVKALNKIRKHSDEFADYDD